QDLLSVSERLQEENHTLRQLTSDQSRQMEALSEARHEASRKERSLRILGKHLSGVQKERKQLEERLQRAEVELRDAASYKEVRESLIQSRHSLLAQPRPLLLPREHLELSGAESIMGDPEVAACQVNGSHTHAEGWDKGLERRGGGGGEWGRRKRGHTHTHTQTQKVKPYVRGHTHTHTHRRAVKYIMFTTHGDFSVM
uniref:Uncharacterized protein n=1 Tax=Seriola lalandi dorsalis TaxID=1841481 RepID=A0A3B4WZP4_SERLL